MHVMISTKMLTSSYSVSIRKYNQLWYLLAHIFLCSSTFSPVINI